MNKLFTKIAGLTLGLSLVVGGGAFLAHSASKDVKASEAAAYTLDGTITATSSGYAADNAVTQGGVSWTANAHVSQNPWRIGGTKSNGLDVAGTVRAIKSTTAVSAEDITKIVVTTEKPSKNSINPTDVSLKVGTAAGGSQTSSLSNGSWAASVTFNRPSGKSWANQYFEIDFTMPANNTTTTKYITLTSIVFYYESAVERGEFSLDPLDSNVLFVGDSGKMNYTWNPLDSGASVASTQFVSSDEDVLTIDNSGNYEAKAAGSVKVTFNATDTNSEEYSVQSSTIFVSNAYDFEVGDKVALHAPSILKELSGIDSGNYGTGADYSTNPNGTFTLDVESGSVGGSLAFSNDGAYLSWASGNTLKTASSIDDNSSWYVIAYDDRYSINNVADNAREIWWNNNSPRFACYTGKTPSTSGYNTVSLYKIDEVPVRGTIAITAPSETLVRQGANGSLEYSWTPADGSSATISSYTWTSSDEAVISVSGDTYSAVAPGKAKLHLHAVDSTSQEYDVQTSDITVVEVVSGSYEKLTSVSDGDVVAIVCEDAGAQLSGITSNVGTYVFYETAPASVYDFTLVANGDYFAFKNADEKYLSWYSGESKFKLIEEGSLDDTAYWSINFDESDNAVIANKDTEARVIKWNNSSPRFAPYAQSGASYYGIQLYGTPGVAPIGIEFNPTASIEVGESNTYVATSTNVTNPVYTFESDNSSVLSVASSGEYEAISYGVAHVTATVTGDEGSKSVTKTIVVNGGALLSVTDANDIANSLASGATTEYYVYVEGYVKAFATSMTSGDDPQPRALDIMLHDESDSIMVFTGATNYASFVSGVMQGDYIKIKANVQNYNNGTYELVNPEKIENIYSDLSFGFELLNETNNVCSHYEEDVAGSTYNFDTYKENLQAIFDSLAPKFLAFDGNTQADIGDIEADESGSVIERAMARYDFLLVKYGLDGFIDAREPDGKYNPIVSSVNNSNSTIALVAIIGFTSITSIAVLLVLKRRKSY